MYRNLGGCVGETRRHTISAFLLATLFTTTYCMSLLVPYLVSPCTANIPTGKNLPVYTIKTFLSCNAYPISEARWQLSHQKAWPNQGSDCLEETDDLDRRWLLQCPLYGRRRCSLARHIYYTPTCELTIDHAKPGPASRQYT